MKWSRESVRRGAFHWSYVCTFLFHFAPSLLIENTVGFLISSCYDCVLIHSAQQGIKTTLSLSCILGSRYRYSDRAAVSFTAYTILYVHLCIPGYDGRSFPWWVKASFGTAHAANYKSQNSDLDSEYRTMQSLTRTPWVILDSRRRCCLAVSQYCFCAHKSYRISVCALSLNADSNTHRDLQ